MKFNQYQYLSNNLFQIDENGTLKERYKSLDADKISPLALAFLGDACFHQYIRLRLLNFEQNKVHILNDFSAKFVSAIGQSIAYKKIKDDFSEKEKDVFRRGFHAKSHAPRACSIHQYHQSTGFEAVLGYLYLTNNFKRLNELCEKSFLSIVENLKDNKRGNI